ncbi:DcaP family trimeric outer membrane transporter [Rheinheimera sp.]|uniref:DcaP family trimeric outer membrane transporter n=1 Tax=Rheinheimera sp. TaxID=1869214 RepID=UPI002736B405|nr:DcaP family trimeric outer membrane transporter [Rheinheimera sp.]MDP2713598.1 DcaP family trimeric outer membrane transporter [Rheinheimera sp.]
MKKITTVSYLAACIALGAGGVQAAGFDIGGTNVTFGGYVKLDAMVSDSDGEIASLGRDFYVPSLTPIGGDSTTRFDMHARQSRFFFSTATELEDGNKITGHLEFDFMTSNNGNDERTTNGYSPVLRHAFIKYKNWTLGQTWSNFMDLASLPDTLDFVGNPDAAVFIRQAQVRYTQGNFAFAIENPESTVTPFGGGGRITTDDNATPDFTASYNLKTDWGVVKVAGLLRQIAIDDGTFDDEVTSYGLSVSTKIDFANKDDLRITLNTGKGLGRYVGLNTVNGAVLDADGNLEAIDVTAFSVAYRHLWNDQWRSTFLYSTLMADNDTALTGTGATKTTQSYSANLLYQATKKLMVGVEYKLANREIEAGADGDMNRIQFSAKYDF